MPDAVVAGEVFVGVTPVAGDELKVESPQAPASSSSAGTSRMPIRRISFVRSSLFEYS